MEDQEISKCLNRKKCSDLRRIKKAYRGSLQMVIKVSAVNKTFIVM